LGIKLPSTIPTIGNGAPDSVQNAVRVLDALHSHSEAIVAEGERLNEDRALSDEGKKATLKKFADERVAAAVKTADLVADGLKAEVAVLKDKLPKLRSVGQTNTHDTIREIEVRDELRKLKPTEVFQLYREAVADADSLVFYAVYNAPHRVMTLVDAEQLEQGKDDFLRNKNPQAFDRHDTAVQILDTLQTGGARFIAEVEEHVAASFNSQRATVIESPFPLPHGA